jgi:predicted GIY-YIG superfamily endonuclease
VRKVLPILSLLFRGLIENWWVYIVGKKTGLYVGITTDLENRMRQHGQPAPYTLRASFRKLTPSKEKERSKVGVERRNWS